MHRQVGHYEILEEIGRGGASVVFKARDVRLGRFVALKVIPEKQFEPRHRERFIREARTASSLNHPNIVTIYDIEVADGEQLIAMEYVPGRVLADLVIPGGLPVSEVLRYALQVTE